MVYRSRGRHLVLHTKFGLELFAHWWRLALSKRPHRLPKLQNILNFRIFTFILVCFFKTIDNVTMSKQNIIIECSDFMQDGELLRKDSFSMDIVSYAITIFCPTNHRSYMPFECYRKIENYCVIRISVFVTSLCFNVFRKKRSTFPLSQSSFPSAGPTAAVRPAPPCTTVWFLQYCVI